MTSPVGFNIHAQSLSGSEKERLLDYLTRLEPSCVVVMDDFALARSVKFRLPECEVVLRDNDVGGRDGAQRRFAPQQVVAGYARAFERGLAAYVNNEDNWSAAHMDWLVETAGLAHLAGGKCVLGNFAVGQPEPEIIAEGRLDNLIRACIEGGHYLGLHEGTYNHLNWREGFPWFTGRFMEIVRRQRDIAGGDPATPPPWIMFTEWGWDGTSPGERGIMAHLVKWQAEGRVDPEAHAFTQLYEVWDEVYGPAGVVKGMCLYCYGAVSEKWRDYDFRKTPGLLAALVESAWEADMEIFPGTYQLMGVSVNLRMSPAGAQVGTLIPGDVVDLTGRTTMAVLGGVEYLWREIHQAGNVRWFAHVPGLTLMKVDPPTPPAPPDRKAAELTAIRNALAVIQETAALIAEQAGTAMEYLDGIIDDVKAD